MLNPRCTLAAMADGGWVVGPSWVHACAEAGGVAPEVGTLNAINSNPSFKLIVFSVYVRNLLEGAWAGLPARLPAMLPAKLPACAEAVGSALKVHIHQEQQRSIPAPTAMLNGSSWLRL